MPAGRMDTENFDVNDRNLWLIFEIAQICRRLKTHFPRLECSNRRWQRVSVTAMPIKGTVSMMLRKHIAILLKNSPSACRLNPLNNLCPLRAPLDRWRWPSGQVQLAQKYKSTDECKTHPNTVDNGMSPHLPGNFR